MGIGTDWRGRRYSTGVRVLYARPHGYGVEMVEAEVIEVTDKGVKVQPLQSSREWSFRSTKDQKPVTLRITENITVID